MTYVISDLHGDLKGFHEILKRINFSENDQLYILGDIVDRGPEPLKLLKEIMNMSAHVLLGNHEYMMLESLAQHYEEFHGFESKELDIYRAQRLWFRNGGTITFDQFIEESKDSKKEILEYLLSLPLNIDINIEGKKFLLCHAAIADDIAYQSYYEWERSIPEFAVWNRNWAQYESIKNVTVITGHTPTGNMDAWKCNIYQYPGGIWDIDTGAAYPNYGGRLCCMRLEDMKVFYNDSNQLINRFELLKR